MADIFIRLLEQHMGTKLAPSYVNILMFHFDTKHVYTYPLQPFLWKRYTDDIFLVVTYSLEELDDFISLLNRCHPTIIFTQELSVNEVPFLDLLIYKSATRLYTRLYVKPTDRHIYLKYDYVQSKSFRDSIP